MTLKKWTKIAKLLLGENNVKTSWQNGKLFAFTRISSKLDWQLWELPWWYDIIGFLKSLLRTYYVSNR